MTARGEIRVVGEDDLELGGGRGEGGLSELYGHVTDSQVERNAAVGFRCHVCCKSLQGGRE